MFALVGNLGSHILSFSTTCNINMAKARNCELRVAVTPLNVDVKLMSLRQLCNVTLRHFMKYVDQQTFGCL